MVKMIYHYRQKAIDTRIDSQYQSYLSRATKYLRYYFYLIVFNLYLSDTYDSSIIMIIIDFSTSFKDWMHEHSEIENIDKIIKNSPDIAVDSNINIDIVKDISYRNGRYI